jgi:hypothetical protein
MDAEQQHNQRINAGNASSVMRGISRIGTDGSTG